VCACIRACTGACTRAFAYACLPLQLIYDAALSARLSKRFFQIYNPNAARVTRAAILFDIGKLS
jgi:hypothetical protein